MNSKRSQLTNKYVCEEILFTRGSSYASFILRKLGTIFMLAQENYTTSKKLFCLFHKMSTQFVTFESGKRHLLWMVNSNKNAAAGEKDIMENQKNKNVLPKKK
ncbi:CLUMA_CG006963, isoform A [Clunio marinus]|uniref:CLUMA_CG006963, isoform A n=1 Tax=Clunio marinus TaxID=568069 RepID=A0A1J1HZP2_9DIPT|nr:CLUMA_CG006963, isoform A [Clunio marinus]